MDCLVRRVTQLEGAEGFNFSESYFLLNNVGAQVDYLERRITQLEDAVEAQGLEVHCVSRAAQDQAIFVGRVCCDTGKQKSARARGP